MPEIVVAFTVSGLREKYLRQALDSWSRVRGVHDVTMVFCVEPAPSFPLADFEGFLRRQFPRYQVCPNGSVLGILKNTRRAFELAFAAGARLAVLAEEDLLVSADVLEYLSWAMAEYESDSEIAAVCAHARDSGCADPGQVTRAPWFNPLVCGTWKDRWEELIGPSWGAWNEGMEGNQAWDNNLRIVLRKAGKSCIFPGQSRVSHIGEISTVYVPAVAEYMYKQSVTTCFQPDHQVTRYREVGFTEIPRLLV